MTGAALVSGMRQTARLGVALAALALPGTTPAAAAKAAPAETTSAVPSLAAPGTPDGFPNLAFLASLAGLPADALASRTFAASFRGAFSDEYFLTERADTTAASRWASEALANRFRLAEGSAFGDEWQLRVTILGWWGIGGLAPPPVETPLVRARGAGLRVAIEVVPGATAEAGQRAVPTREDLTFDVSPEARGAFFAHAGRAVGLLAIESLHHHSGDLDATVHVRLDSTVRVPVVERTLAPHR